MTVMGLGLHGGSLGTINWLLSQKAKVTVTDLKSDRELEATIKNVQQPDAITWVFEKHREEDFSHADLVIQNPAVRRESPYIALARRHGVPVEMDSSLFFQYCPSRTVIGVTGSKGKSSTVHAIAHVLQLKYPHTVVVGTEGASPLGKLSEITSDTLVVFELSSWRLEGLAEKQVSPQTAVVTSIYEDHLNTYTTYDEYIATKKNIIRFQKEQDRALLNADDRIIRGWAKEVRGNTFWYSLGSALPGYGIFVRRGMIMAHLPRGTVSLFPLHVLHLSSQHARRNVLPAILLAFLGGIRIESIQLNIENLRGLAHRLEAVRTLRNVTYINDSAATMPDATMAALQSFQDRPLVLIMGGSDKRLRFEPLALMLGNTNARAFIFLPGNATDRLRDHIEGVYTQPPSMYTVETMTEAVAVAHQIARPGDTVLLSPACTSFGAFAHEFDRGNQFKAAVHALT